MSEKVPTPLFILGPVSMIANRHEYLTGFEVYIRNSLRHESTDKVMFL
jgi:hypothetical protein